MSDESGVAPGSDAADGEPEAAAASDSDPAEEADDVEPMPGLSDDGILLFFAAAACLVSAAVALATGVPVSVAVLAAVGGVPAGVAFAVDIRTEYVPGTGVELLVGGAAVLGALVAVPGRHYATIATLLAAGALVLWRVVDVEARDAER